MIYQGPESFRELVEKLYEKIKTAFPRNDTLHVIVGGIGRIYNDGDEVITQGDSETSSVIDQRFKALLQISGYDSSQVGRARDDLMAACDDAYILDPDILGEYTTPLDLIVLSPHRIAKYLLASREDPQRVMKAQDMHVRAEYLVDMNFPHCFAHEMVHWDFGDTQFNRDLQRYFHALGLAYDKSVHGKFPFDTEAKESSRYRQVAAEFSEIGLEAYARLNEHHAKIVELGIHDLGEMVAQVGAISIVPPTHGEIIVNDPQDVARMLLSKARSEGPTDFIRHLKQVHDEAYAAERNVFELLK